MSELKAVTSMQLWEITPGDMIRYDGEPLTVVSVTDDQLVVTNEWEETLTIDVDYDQTVELLVWEDEE